MNWQDWVTVGFCSAGAVFFTGGTVGLLRFPDFFSRLHALTKADNLGLGLVVVGLCFQAGELLVVLKLLLIWWLALLAGSSMCYLLGRHQFTARPHGRAGKGGMDSKNMGVGHDV